MNLFCRSNSLDGGSAEEKYQHVEESEFKKRFIASITGSLEEKMNSKLHSVNVSENCY